MSIATPQITRMPAVTQTRSSPRLSSRARAGLDAARACSAVYVVLHHTSTALPMPAFVTASLSCAQEAVMVFFLLSGFVIFANESERLHDLRAFYLRRLRRIYPVVLVAMGVSTGVWALGLAHHEPSWRSALATVFSIDDLSSKPGLIGETYLGNAPLWSLSYEVFFYAIFPVVVLLWRRRPRFTRHLVGALAVIAYASFLAYPNHFSLVSAYFVLWWSGAAAAKAHLGNGIHFGALRIEFGWLATLTLVAVAGLVIAGFQGLAQYPFLMVRHFTITLVLLLLLATPVRSLLGRLAEHSAGAWAWIASISYGLYALHYPVLIQPCEVFGWVAFVPLLALTVVLAWFIERGLMPLIPHPRTRWRTSFHEITVARS
jgi:peptidoglycan/LPS O-acetylase OafA/YrhL